VQPPSNNNLQNASADPRPCPVCGKLMSVVTKEPTDERDFCQRTFVCLSCGYGETSIAKIDAEFGR